jgi:glutamine synthetase
MYRGFIMDKIKQWLAEHNVKYVQCVITDHTGIARGKIYPVQKFIEEGGSRLGETILLMSATGDLAADEFLYTLADPRDIDMLLEPDENACYMVPWAKEPTAMIIHNCIDQKTLKPVEQSPRDLLKKVMKLYDDQGWKAVVAPEMELYFTLSSTDSSQPLTTPLGNSGRSEAGRQSFGIDAITEFEPVMTDIYEWSAQQNLAIDVVVHEEGKAQFEFNFDHGDPLSLADQVIVFKRTVKAAANKHGMTATFMAKPITGQPGSAMHIHQSIVEKSTGKNIFAGSCEQSTEFSQNFMHYLGGLQTFIPQLMLMFAPNINSYRRFLADSATPVNLEWGIENRTVGLRIPDAPDHAKRVENRIPGADANPYLAIAATLICGYIGMMEKISPADEVTGKANNTINKNLPINIEAAMQQMEQSDKIKHYLGESFVTGFIATRRADYDNYKSVISSWERHYLLTTV